MRRLVRLSVALLLTVTAPAMADVHVSEAKLRLLPGNLPAAGYFTLTNSGSQTVVLTSARSPIFAKAEILLLDLRQQGEFTDDLFAEVQPAAAERVMGVPDQINGRLGERDVAAGECAGCAGMGNEASSTTHSS